MTVPYTFATASGNVPLSELDANFASLANNVSTANTAMVAETVSGNVQANITTVGTLTNLSVAGNVIANLFVGNIAGSITNAVYANTAGSANFANSATTATLATLATSATTAGTAGTVINPVQANITTVGTLGNLSVSGNVVAGRFIGNIANTTGQVGNALIAGTVYANAQPNITSVGTLVSVSSTGGLFTSGVASVAGNVVSNNINTIGNVNANNVVFNNTSKFSSASWLVAETIVANLATGDQNVATSNSFSYYASNYNEVLLICGAGGYNGTIVIPVGAVPNNSSWIVNSEVGVRWSNISNASITVFKNPSYGSTVNSVTVNMQVR
jgi:hypothetical protein